MTLLVIGGASVFASENIKTPTATIIITDPETGQVWKSDLPAEDVQIQSAPRTFSATGEIEETVMVSVDAGEYIQETLSDKPISTTLEDDITLMTGMTYVFSGSNVKITSVTGKTTPKGLYYATDRKQYYRHPGTGAGGEWYPTSDKKWTYTVNSGYGLYSAQAPPKATLDCTIRVSGMTTYRNVSVFCSL